MHRRWPAFWLLTLAPLAGCGNSAEPAAPSSRSPTSTSSGERAVAVPEPDLAPVSDPGVSAAITQARQNVLNQPTSAAAWARYGHVLFIHFFRPEAVACYRRATQLEPHDFRWWYYFGKSQAKTDSAAAREALARALELDDNYAPLHAAYAGLLEEVGGGPALAHHLKRAVELDPDSETSLLLRAALAEMNQDAAAARRDLEALLARHPNCRDAHHALLRVCQAVGDQQGAAKHAQALATAHERAESTDPLWEEVIWSAASREELTRQAEFLLSAGQPALALERYERILEFHQPAADLLVGYASALRDAGQLDRCRPVFEEAIARCRTALEADNDTATLNLLAQALRGLAIAEVRADHWDPAESLLRQALESVPDDPITGAYLGNLLGQLGVQAADRQQWEDAQRRFREAASLLPNDPEAAYNLAWTLWKQGRSADALAELAHFAEKHSLDDRLNRLRREIEEPSGP